MKQLISRTVFHAAGWAGLAPALRRAFAGRAAILMLHEIQQDWRWELKTGASPDFLEYSLKWLRQEGWEIVSLDTCLEQLAADTQPHRYAVLTFDDGYRDNVATALPILERHNAPFTVYVPTGAVTRTLQPWWLGLRELFRLRDSIAIDGMAMRFSCRDFDEKASALEKVSNWVHEDYHRVEMLTPTFNKAGLSLESLNDTYFLNGAELQALARHPLASIGGHTESHPALAYLNEALARAEMADNRNYLEGLLQRPVRHVAFPYGNARACGPREQHLAVEAGFSTAVTTRHGQISDRKPNHFALPRIALGGPFDSRIAFEGRMNGVQSAVEMLLGRSN
ncbi:polysaccharide deacetylase family protein [Bradyrhizobium septentrionale]|uniref:Chitooligosaccharide deacetylase n=1 Tax=Bradyrhizobium septentrionale TaxID=1404411 RepID=A0ABZ2NUM6_9BRAD|nr:polysaccharide deacetylase family protein [Bradyrhizobium septentrionale]UGY17341.1 polysaccharide deacetylase family protein [Bradyrhizobium septentrionale]UGY26084.1 polysaccharide deacetylase family protein [Bradyrhizobium septentrionale]